MKTEMRPGQKRRLAAEQAIYKKFPSMEACIRACRKYSEDRNLGVGFCQNSVRQYVACTVNFSMKRLTVLCDVLGVVNPIEIDEIFTAPEHRGVGLEWIGERGNKVKDFDARYLN